ncbi:MAG: hypothetical protein R3E31_03315 [Chloroflexota bacterium]
MLPPWGSDYFEDGANEFMAMEEVVHLAILMLASLYIFYAHPGTLLVFLTLVIVSWLYTRSSVNEQRLAVRRWFGRLMPPIYYGLCIATYVYILTNFPGACPEVLLGILAAPGMMIVLMRPLYCEQSIRTLTWFWIAFVSGTAFVSLFLGFLPNGVWMIFEFGMVLVTIKKFLTDLNRLGQQSIPINRCWLYLRRLSGKKLASRLLGEIIIEVIAGLIVALLLTIL